MTLCFLTQWAEYVLFASLLVAVSIIFSIMAYFYTYIDPAEIEAQIRKEQGLEPEETEKETLEMEEKDEDQKNEQEVKQTKIWDLWRLDYANIYALVPYLLKYI